MKKLSLIVRGRNDENIANARHHQGRKRIINHRLVVDREELLRHHQSHGMQPCTSSAGKNNSFHESPPGEFKSEATTSRVRSRQSTARNPKVATKRDESSTELAGRFAGVGYSAVVIAITFGRR